MIYGNRYPVGRIHYISSVPFLGITPKADRILHIIKLQHYIAGYPRLYEHPDLEQIIFPVVPTRFIIVPGRGIILKSVFTNRFNTLLRQCFQTDRGWSNARIVEL